MITTTTAAAATAKPVTFSEQHDQICGLRGKSQLIHIPKN